MDACSCPYRFALHPSPLPNANVHGSRNPPRELLNFRVVTMAPIFWFRSIQVAIAVLLYQHMVSLIDHPIRFRWSFRGKDPLPFDDHHTYFHVNCATIHWWTAGHRRCEGSTTASGNLTRTKMAPGRHPDELFARGGRARRWLDSRSAAPARPAARLTPEGAS